MDQRHRHKHVCVARNKDLVNLGAFARCFAGATCQKRRAQAQSLADPVIDIRNAFDLLIGPSVVAFDSLVKQSLKLFLLLGALC